MGSLVNDGKKDLNAYLNYLIIEDRSVPSFNDPCLAVSKTSNVNFIQNLKAKVQTIRVVEKAGLKAKDLDDKHRKLLKNNSKISDVLNAFIPQRSIFNNTVDGITFDGQVESKSSKGENDKPEQNIIEKSSKHWRVGVNDIGGINGDLGYGSLSEVSERDITFSSQQIKGKYHYTPIFFNKVNRALAGKLSVNSLTLNQKYAYNEILERERVFQKRRKKLKYMVSGGKNRYHWSSKYVHLSIEEQKLVNKLAREIWFKKSLNLFEIISNRYKSKFFNK
jgi:DNA-binding transcriptional regulator YhcF (GntR family)